VAEQVFAQWVMEAHCANAAEGAGQEDIIQPVDGMEPWLETNIAPALTEPNIVLSETE